MSKSQATNWSHFGLPPQPSQLMGTGKTVDKLQIMPLTHEDSKERLKKIFERPTSKDGKDRDYEFRPKSAFLKKQSPYAGIIPDNPTALPSLKRTRRRSITQHTSRVSNNWMQAGLAKDDEQKKILDMELMFSQQLSFDSVKGMRALQVAPRFTYSHASVRKEEVSLASLSDVMTIETSEKGTERRESRQFEPGTPNSPFLAKSGRLAGGRASEPKLDAPVKVKTPKNRLRKTQSEAVFNLNPTRKQSTMTNFRNTDGGSPTVDSSGSPNSIGRHKIFSNLRDGSGLGSVSNPTSPDKFKRDSSFGNFNGFTATSVSIPGSPENRKVSHESKHIGTLSPGSGQSSSSRRKKRVLSFKNQGEEASPTAERKFVGSTSARAATQRPQTAPRDRDSWQALTLSPVASIKAPKVGWNRAAPPPGRNRLRNHSLPGEENMMSEFGNLDTPTAEFDASDTPWSTRVGHWDLKMEKVRARRVELLLHKSHKVENMVKMREKRQQMRVEQERRKRQQKMLMVICATGAAAQTMWNSITKSRHHKTEVGNFREKVLCANNIQFWWRRMQVRKMLEGNNKALLAIRKLIRMQLARLFMQRASHSAALLTDFLVNARKASKMRRGGLRFRFRLRRMQMWCRGWVICRRARLQLLSLTWEQIESRIHRKHRLEKLRVEMEERSHAKTKELAADRDYIKAATVRMNATRDKVRMLMETKGYLFDASNDIESPSLTLSFQHQRARELAIELFLKTRRRMHAKEDYDKWRESQNRIYEITTDDVKQMMMLADLDDILKYSDNNRLKRKRHTPFLMFQNQGKEEFKALVEREVNHAQARMHERKSRSISLVESHTSDENDFLFYS